MARRFIDQETGKQVTRLEVVERFEVAEGRKFSTPEFESYLEAIEHYEIHGEWDCC